MVPVHTTADGLDRVRRSLADDYGCARPAGWGWVGLFSLVKIFYGIFGIHFQKSIRNTKRRLITKVITQMDRKSRDEPIKPNEFVIKDWLL
jgi:hypothetical protein